jgi:uroporphyrinogen-III synthase
MSGLVVITRPRDEADQLAASLTALGYRTLVEPMLRVAELPVAIPDLGAYDALAFTSANGVRIFAGKSAERNLPAFAVGVRTAEALRAAGFADVRTAEGGDAVALARLIREAPPAQSHILHVTGTAVARDLGELLHRTGRSVERLMVYRTDPASALSADLVAALYACTIGYVLFYSPRTAATFGTLVSEHGLADMIRSFTALCLSSQIAAKAQGLPWASIAVAARPTSESLLSLLPPAGARHG